MVQTVSVTDAVNARAPRGSLVLSWGDGVRVRVADLIRERVRLEWERREAPAGAGLAPLVRVDAHRPWAAGAAPWPPVPVVGRGTLENAISVALQGFARNAFLILVDAAQVTELEAEIGLTPATEITFVRLMPLAGG